MRTAFLGIFLSLLAPGLAAAHGDRIVKDAYETMAVAYACSGDTRITVRYLNMKDGVSLAILVIEGEIILMETAISGSGARYVSADPQTPYQWWTKGSDGMLDRLGPDGNVQSSVLSGCVEEGH